MTNARLRKKRPLGYGKERFFRSFAAAIFIFGVGATYAAGKGIQKLTRPRLPENFIWRIGLQGVSFVLEAKQIPVNARVNLKNDSTNERLVGAIGEIEARVKEAEPKVSMIFLKTANPNASLVKEAVPNRSAEKFEGSEFEV